jgi:hypothetical protein
MKEIILEQLKMLLNSKPDLMKVLIQILKMIKNKSILVLA